MDPVRTGIVGYGLGGRVFHAPLIRAAPECALVGVVTRSPQRQAEVAELGVPSYDSLSALAEAGAEAVAISTPADTHVPLTQEALRLGLAVVCDKPFALDAAAAQQTVALARELGLVLSPYQNRRWDSDVLTVQRLLRDGELGALLRVESRFERFRPERGPGPAGGGTLLDLGSHLVDQALVLAGPVVRVYGELHRHDVSGLDDDVFAALTHASGVVSHLWAGTRQGAPGPRFRVTGTTGTYVVDGLDGQEEALRSGALPGDGWFEEPPSAWGRLSRGGAGEPVPSERGRWDTYYPAFARAVRGQGPVPVEPADAVVTARVLDAVRASAGSGTVVTL